LGKSEQYGVNPSYKGHVINILEVY
jgi:hypothetical protein